MEVKIINESGYGAALYGLGLSYGITSGMDYNEFVRNDDLMLRMGKVALKLATRNPSESKFLRFMTVDISVTASRYFWQECSTYRVGGTDYQSASTRHTLGKRELSVDDFERMEDGTFSPLLPHVIDVLNLVIQTEGPDSESLRMMLPESFLQQRIMHTNYLMLRNIITQRKNHKLWQWHTFCRATVMQAGHPEFLQDLLPEDY